MEAMASFHFTESGHQTPQIPGDPIEIYQETLHIIYCPELLRKAVGSFKPLKAAGPDTSNYTKSLETN